MNNNQQMQVDFHNKAKELFFSVYHSFEKKISGLNRRSNEYRFQEVKKQHSVLLKEELDKLAKDILLEYRNEKQSRELDQMLHQFINDYLHRFVQKINAF